MFILAAIGWAESLFTGLKAGISVIVLQALTKMAVRGLTHPMDWLIAIAGFIGIFFANVPFPLIIASAALYGFYASQPLNDHKSVIPLPDYAQHLSDAHAMDGIMVGSHFCH